MEGMYFTDRYTKGDLTMTLVSRDTDAGSFSEAARQEVEATAKQGLSRKSNSYGRSPVIGNVWL